MLFLSLQLLMSVPQVNKIKSEAGSVTAEEIAALVRGPTGTPVSSPPQNLPLSSTPLKSNDGSSAGTD